MTTARLVFGASMRDLASNRWVLAYAVGLAVVTEALFWFGGTSPQVVVSMLNLTLLVVPLVALVFGTVHVYASREFVELLLAQPVPRAALFRGLYLGLALPLACAFLAGVLGPFAVHAIGSGDRVNAGALVALLGAGVGLSLVFAALAVTIAFATDDRLRGVGAAIGIWLVTTVLYDAAVLAAVAAFGRWPIEGPMLAMLASNPVDVARVLVLVHGDAPALMGYTGALFLRTFGAVNGTVIAGATLSVWCAVPLLIAARRFRTRDF